MHFSTPLLTLLAIAAGVQAAKQSEPPILSRSVSVQGTAVSTGTHPIMTGGGGGGTTNGTSGTNGTTTGGGGGGGGGGATSAGSASSSGAAGATATGASNTPASPSSTGFVPSNPGAKVSIPMVGAGLGSIAYGALIFLA